jgi:hypothetical protein
VLAIVHWAEMYMSKKKDAVAVVDIREVALEVNHIKPCVCSCLQNRRQSHNIRIANAFFGNVVKFSHLAIMLAY